MDIGNFHGHYSYGLKFLVSIMFLMTTNLLSVDEMPFRNIVMLVSVDVFICTYTKVSDRLW